MAKNRLRFVFLSFSLLALLCVTANAQKRDNLTPQEDDLIREAEFITVRVAVYVKAIDRRLLVISNPNAAQTKEVQKDSSTWGELPKGTRLELLTDIRRILDEIIGKLDDVYTHEPNNPLLNKALHDLARESARLKPTFKSMLDTTMDEKEKAALMTSIEDCENVIEAAGRLPEQKLRKND
jgi:hypothetical protein